MIKISELKPGDLVIAEYEGQRWEGTVTDINREDKEIGVETSVQEFWFKPEHVFPIPLDESQLMKLGFEKKDAGDGAVKYSKDSFRVLVPRAGDFNNIEIWWREDKRRLHQAIHVHELQNHYLDMTKVELNPA